MLGSTLAIERRLHGNQPSVEQHPLQPNPISPIDQAFLATAFLANAAVLQFIMLAVVANALSINPNAPQPALRPESTYAQEQQPELALAPHASLVVQEAPANQPDITHSHVVPQPAPWAAQQAEQIEGLTEGLMAIFTMGGPTTNMTLTPDMRDALELHLDKMENYLSKFPALFENMKQRYEGKGPELDAKNPQQALAQRYFAWREALDAPQPEPAFSPRAGA